MFLFVLTLYKFIEVVYEKPLIPLVIILFDDRNYYQLLRMKRVIISIGNPLKSDDNISNLILDELQKNMKDRNFYFIKAGTNPENFIEPLRKIKPDIVYFIDIALFQGSVGDIKLFQLEDILNYNISTHNLPITVFRKFFPKSKIILIGIKPKSLDFGENLTPELQNKFEEIVKKVKTIVEHNL